MPLLRAIEIASDEIPDIELRNIIYSIKTYLEQGESISDAFRRYPKYFSKFAIAIIDSGEQEGRLEDNFAKLAESLRRETDNRKTIQSNPISTTHTFPAAPNQVNETTINTIATQFASSFVIAVEQLFNKSKQERRIPKITTKVLCPKCRKKVESISAKSTKLKQKRTKKK